MREIVGIVVAYEYPQTLLALVLAVCIRDDLPIREPGNVWAIAYEVFVYLFLERVVRPSVAHQRLLVNGPVVAGLYYNRSLVYYVFAAPDFNRHRN